MKEIKIYLDLEAIEKATKRKFDIENQYSDNFLQWIEFLVHCLSTDNENFTKDQKEKANELHNILKNCYSDYEMERSIRKWKSNI